MNAAERLATLEALKSGIESAIAAAKRDVLAVREMTGAKTFDTPYGSVTIASRKGAIAVSDEAEFTAWVASRMPSEIIHTVRDSSRAAILGTLTV